MCLSGWSYYMIKDFKAGRQAFETILNQYSDHSDAVKSAQESLKWLQNITGGKQK